jgi:Telomere regulation protein Stn1
MERAEFYPRELWQHSPVYNSFVKLFAKDIHTLQASPDGQPTVTVGLIAGSESIRFWLNHPIRWVQVIGIIVALTQKEKSDVILRKTSNVTDLGVDDSSGETIELVIAQEEHRKMMPDRDDDEKQERLWKRRRKPGHVDVGSLIKVKGEIIERWNVRKIHVMKLGISFSNAD